MFIISTHSMKRKRTVNLEIYAIVEMQFKAILEDFYRVVARQTCR